MPWVVGIDEAGYGPNLGPLVMTAAACAVPGELAEADLWRVLRRAVRRHGEPDDGRLLVADSKLVYSAARGLAGLEKNILPCLRGGLTECDSLRTALHHLCEGGHAELAGECWYAGTTALPAAASADECGAASDRLGRSCADAGMTWGLFRSVVVCPRRFNAIAERWNSKGAVLNHGLAELSRCVLTRSRDDAVHFVVDKHGGRNTYGAMLQEAVPAGFVAAEEEGMACSRYRVHGLDREVTFAFRPRADADHFCVAVASMVSKYVRELLMGEFNRFWQERVPGLKPTAGYPGDAARFLEAIRPHLPALQLDEAAVWRRR